MLFSLVPAPDVGDPRAFATGVVAIFALYPPPVMREAVDPATGIPSRTDRLTLKLIKAACEEIYAPIRRHEEEAACAQQRRLMLPPPVDRSKRPTMEELEQKLGRKIAVDHGPGKPPPLPEGDGKHALRVAAEIAARRARAEVKE